ncbi:YceI family protein [Geofilum rubicundum]|uniref:Rhodanese-like domain protein n=1 Tax=Geofilum rubicundum JCM 15548 TaxID=1236989 RepID=A0A0E9LX74_9BACT|nr:YceI family protein [Geofilum rubicundum]GAO29746.1 rhodanese-like domain protein [Geofilum rubicundum JCM 15548]
MKTTTLFIALLVAGFTASAQQLSLDVAKSSIEWTGKKIGGQHNGDIKFISGHLNSEGRAYTSGEFIVDMTSIVVEDIEDPETNAKLEGHLKSDDFFGVATYPTAKLVIDKGVLVKDNTYEFTGKLTIKKNTEPVTIKATMDTKDGHRVFTGQLVVDRSKYDVRYGSKSFFDNLGDNMIYDDFTLDFKVILNE